MPRLARSSLLTSLIAALCLTFAATASARSTSGAAVALPTPAAAKSIVSDLWTQREAALTLLNPGLLGPLEMGAAKQLDGAYIDAVICSCSAAKDPHPLEQIVPEVPKSSVQPVFFAEVRTSNARTEQHPWYVVAVAREAGRWKFAFISFATYDAAPPLPELAASNGITPPVSASLHAHMSRMATYAANASSAHSKGVAFNDYGGKVRTHAMINGPLDGVYGLALPAGRILSCYTLHVLGTTTLKGGLEQDAAQKNWSKLLPAGVYKSITVDTATPQCMVGAGVGTTPGKLRLQYDDTIVGVTGVRM